MLKTSYRCSNIDNDDLLEFSIQDFNNCQAIHQQEVRQLEKWMKEYRLEHLKFDWQILITSYFLMASAHFSPELAAARFISTKNYSIAIIIDDVCDIDDSREELLNIIELVEKYDEGSDIGYYSKRIEIISSVLHDTINEFTAKALIKQGRCIKHELIESWLIYLKGMMAEVNWRTHSITPSMDEYLFHAIRTVGVVLYFQILYFLGIELSAEVLKSEEFRTLFHHGGTIARLFNDYQGYEREKEQRKWNACRILIKQENEAITEEDARKEIRRIIEKSTRESLRMCLQREGSLVPEVIKESIWNLNKISHHLYTSNDEFRCPSFTLDDIKVVLYDPIQLPPNIKVESC